MNKALPTEVERFNLEERIQHMGLFITFLILAFTGWGLKYAYVEPSSMWIKVWGGAKAAGTIHRAAGVLMLLVFSYHIVYLVRKALTGKFRLTLLPLPKDAIDLLQNLMYYVGLRKDPPQFGKFTYLQKFDYWAVFWGMLIIGTSGLFLTFPVTVSALWPEWSIKWIWDVLFTMHSDEALLAVVFILFIHFYSEHLKPGNFPMSWSWLTGKMSVEKLKHEHPLEYDHLFGKDAGPRKK